MAPSSGSALGQERAERAALELELPLMLPELTHGSISPAPPQPGGHSPGSVPAEAPTGAPQTGGGWDANFSVLHVRCSERGRVGCFHYAQAN